MTNLTTTDLETVHGGCHTAPCHNPPCHKPPCHKPPCHKPEHPRQPTHGGSFGGSFGNLPADFGNGWGQNPAWPTFPTYQTATAPTTAQGK